MLTNWFCGVKGECNNTVFNPKVNGGEYSYLNK